MHATSHTALPSSGDTMPSLGSMQAARWLRQAQAQPQALRPELALLAAPQRARSSPVAHGRSPSPLDTRCTMALAMPGEADLHAEPAAERGQQLRCAPAGAARVWRVSLARRRVCLRRRQRQPQRRAGGCGQHAQAARAAELQRGLPLHSVGGLVPRTKVRRLERAAAGLRRPAALI